MGPPQKRPLSQEDHQIPTIPEAKYGVGECKPSWLQCLANMKAFTANIGLIFFIQVATMTYNIGTLRTVEKRFGLKSQETGLLGSIGDIVQVFLVLIIGYFARKSHKPHFLSISILLVAIGVFLSAIPYLIYGSKENLLRSAYEKANLTLSTGSYCSSDDGLSCESSGSVSLNESNQVAFSFFVLTAIVAGVGGASLNILGISYIDENLPKKDTPIYIAAATLMYPVGPVFGFLLAAVATSIPENLSESSLDNTDPAFIGAWWLGDIIFPICCLVFAVPLFFFPKHFPEYYRQKYKRLAETKKEKETTVSHGEKQKKSTGKIIWTEIKNFPASAFKLLSIPEFVTQALSNIFGVYIIIGVFANFARYAEIHFLQPAYTANIFAAVSMAGAGAIGNLSGGLIMKKLKLGAVGAAKMHVFTALFTVIATVVLLLIPCAQINLAGEKTAEGLIDVDMSCSANCSCALDFFIPACGPAPDGSGQKITYVSPCHAGCIDSTTIDGKLHFTNCSCIPGPDNMTVKGFCEEPCSSVYGYLVVMFLMGVIGGSGRVPSTIVTLRIVPPEMKSFALGLISFFINLLAFIPGPLLFGSVQDATCLVWSENCGKKGNCIFYDTAIYRRANHGIALIFLTASFIFVLLTWLLIRRAAIKHGKYTDALTKETVNLGENDDDKKETMVNGSADTTGHIGSDEAMKDESTINGVLNKTKF